MSKFVLLSYICLIAPSIRADCPTPTVNYAWQNGISENYSWPTPNPPAAFTGLSIDNIGIGGDLSSAFSQWTYADQSQNPSNVTFYYIGGGAPYNVYAYQVNYPGQPGLDPGQAAQTTTAVYEGTSIVAVSDTYLYIGSICSAGYPCYDQSAGDYHTFIQKVMAHEIGHTMGLADQPRNPNLQCDGQVAGQSVMNSQCGTNDQGNNLPAPALGLPPCDNGSIY